MTLEFSPPDEMTVKRAKLSKLRELAGDNPKRLAAVNAVATRLGIQENTQGLSPEFTDKFLGGPSVQDNPQATSEEMAAVQAQQKFSNIAPHDWSPLDAIQGQALSGFQTMGEGVGRLTASNFDPNNAIRGAAQVVSGGIGTMLSYPAGGVEYLSSQVGVENGAIVNRGLTTTGYTRRGIKNTPVNYVKYLGTTALTIFGDAAKELSKMTGLSEEDSSATILAATILAPGLKEGKAPELASWAKENLVDKAAGRVKTEVAALKSRKIPLTVRDAATEAINQQGVKGSSLPGEAPKLDLTAKEVSPKADTSGWTRANLDTVGEGGANQASVQTQLLNTPDAVRLNRVVQKAGFKSLYEAIQEVAKGNETALQILKPQEINQVTQLAEQLGVKPNEGRMQASSFAPGVRKSVEQSDITRTRNTLLNQRVPSAKISELTTPDSPGSWEKDSPVFADNPRDAYNQSSLVDPEIAGEVRFRQDWRGDAGRYRGEPVSPTPTGGSLEGAGEGAGRAPGGLAGSGGTAGPIEGQNGSSASPGAPVPSEPNVQRGRIGGNFDRNIESFRRDFPSQGTGNELSDKLGMVDAKASGYLGKAATKANEEFAKLSFIKGQETVARENIGKWLERTEPTPPWAQSFVDAVREGNKQNAENFNASKSLIQDPVKGWRQMNPAWDEAFTHKIDPTVKQEWIQENRPGYTGPTPWNDLWAKANPGSPNPMEWSPEDSGPRVENSGGFYAGSEKPRTFNVPEEMRPKDAYSAVQNHWRRTSLVAAENEIFKQTRQNPKTGFWAKDAGDLQKIYDRISNSDKRGNAAAEQAKFRVDRILERNPQDVQSETSRGFNRLASIGTGLSKLAGSVMQIAQQTTQGRNAFAETGSSYFKGLADYIGGRSESVERGRMSGAIEQEALLRSLDFIDDSGGGRLYHAGRATLGLTQAPQSFLDLQSRAITADTAPYFQQDVLNGFKSGGKAATKAERVLNRYDMPEQYKVEFRNGTPSADASQMFQQRLVGFTNVRAGVTEFPRIAGDVLTSPGTRWLRSLKTYQIGDAMFFIKAPLTEAANGNFAPLARYIAASTVIGELYRGAGNVVGKPVKLGPSWEDINKKDGMEWVGAVGKHLGADAMMGGSPGFTGPLIAALRSGSTNGFDNWVRTFLPPAVSDILTTGDEAWKSGTRQTRQRSMQEGAAKGELRNPSPSMPRNRSDAWIKGAKETLKRLFPQIRTDYNAIFDRQANAPKKKLQLTTR